MAPIMTIIARLLDNEFTQLMKGLQGERLRQSFKHLDANQDGYIEPEQFKRIILVCPIPLNELATLLTLQRNSKGTSSLIVL